MAKTKQDYIVDGAKLFKDGKDRPDGNSWQAKAVQEGWDCSFTDKQDDILDVREEKSQTFKYVWDALCDTQEEKDAMQKEINRRNSVIHPALMHIIFLKKEALRIYNSDYNRGVRLMSKAEVLINKHGFTSSLIKF